jgi:NAD(P)-dependent dehydrogenase (short-subunit alcohol dehydrogenase family)
MNNCLVITGASRGIGRAAAEFFVDKKWSVINLSRHECTVKDVINIKVDFLNADWVESAQSMLKETIKKHQKICLVHNAATNEKDNILNLSAPRLRSVLEVNVVVPLQLNQLLIKEMSPDSSIIYVGSTLSEKAIKNAASYVISKHALVGLMRSTCQDLTSTRVHTACICPGFTDTDMLREHMAGDQNILQVIAEKVTAHRLIEPSEIAEVIWFCANNPVINGSVIHANLGQIER